MDDQIKDIIINIVSKYYGVEIPEMRGTCQKQSLVKARQISFYFMREMTMLSLREIGNTMFRHHATVIHSCNLVKDEVTLYRQFRDEIQMIREEIEKEIDRVSFIQLEDEVFQQSDFFINV